MANWHYQKNGTTHGPIESAKLKQLARTGELRPDDLLRRDDMQSWTKASKVQGLFEAATQAQDGTRQAPLASVTNPSPTSDNILSTTNAPATDSSSSRKKSKLRRNVIIGVGVLLVIGFIGHVVDLRKMNASYAEATNLWDAGQKQEALALYRTLKDREELRDERRQVLFQRLVDHEVASGSTDAARQLLQQAVQAGVVVTPSTNEGQRLLAAIQAEEATKAKLESEKQARAKMPKPPKNLIAERMLKNLDHQIAPLDNSTFTSLEAAINKHDADSLAELLKRNGPYSLFSQEEAAAMEHPVGGFMISPSDGSFLDNDHNQHQVSTPIMFWSQVKNIENDSILTGSFYRPKNLGERELFQCKSLWFKRTYKSAEAVCLERITFCNLDGTETSVIVENGTVAKVRCVTPGEDRVDMIPRQRRVFDAKANDYRQEEYLDRVTYKAPEKKIYRISFDVTGTTKIEKGEWEGY